MKEEKPLGRKTSPGFADPNAAVRLDTPVAVPRAAPVPLIVPPSSDAPRKSKQTRPMVEVEVVHERSRVPRPHRKNP